MLGISELTFNKMFFSVRLFANNCVMFLLNAKYSPCYSCGMVQTVGRVGLATERNAVRFPRRPISLCGTNATGPSRDTMRCDNSGTLPFYKDQMSRTK